VPLPERITRFNRAVTNPLLRGACAVVPGMAVLHHVGRRSGRSYRTPLMAFRRGDTWYVVLTYGPDRDWIKNLRAAGEGELVQRRRCYRVGNPRFVSESEAKPAMYAFARAWSRTMNAHEFFAVDEIR
jgi:deazaflavin-dependent oxidoreductase (nitroreductase family)